MEYAWFKSYLFSRKAVVSYNRHVSHEQEIYNGVPQGSMLGPLFFIILFNDITDVLQHSRTVKYADDTVIYFADIDLKDIQLHLTEDTGFISKWPKENEPIVQTKAGENEVLLFGTTKRFSMQSESFKVYRDRFAIRNTGDYKYLGI